MMNFWTGTTSSGGAGTTRLTESFALHYGLKRSFRMANRRLTTNSWNSDLMMNFWTGTTSSGGAGTTRLTESFALHYGLKRSFRMANRRLTTNSWNSERTNCVLATEKTIFVAHLMLPIYMK